MCKMKKCKSTISFGDDFGDNETTFHCRLESGHDGDHIEKGDMYGVPYEIKWKNKVKISSDKE